MVRYCIHSVAGLVFGDAQARDLKPLIGDLVPASVSYWTLLKKCASNPIGLWELSLLSAVGTDFP